MEVYLLSEEQKDLLVGRKLDEVTYFNPTKDKDGFWFISIEEIQQCTKPEFNWINNLTPIVFNPDYGEI